jgi:hypothetical protein
MLTPEIIGDDVAARLGVDADHPGKIVVAIEKGNPFEERAGLR